MESPSKLHLNKKTAWKNAQNNSNNSSTSLSFNSNKSTTGSCSGGSGASSNSTSIDEEVDSLMNERIIQSLTSKYTEGCEEGNCDQLLGKTLEHLRENIKAGICLICIEDVGRNEAIWSCDTCYCILHLVCIQRWARDSIANVKEKAVERMITNLPIIFCCPKCRNDYSEKEFPDKYRCFCGKEVNPGNDAWNAPHSCGETCGKALKPECGHYCLLLCHSGPCPPCPKQVTNTCHCGQSPPQTFRCFSKTWSCGSPCSKTISCSFHPCPETCHAGPCPPCEVLTTLHCKCSSPSKIVTPCWKLASGEFVPSCGQPCGKLLTPCGIHHCSQICHESLTCPPCERSCPCGKARVPCVTSSPDTGKPCGDACDKVLDCGNHSCTSKCHLGSCGSCLVHVAKRCRCGAQEKEILCSKEFICGNKCKRMRDCKTHPCNRKCCPGDCPPCRNVCGRTLACKNHKCESLCHGGSPCYPCPVSGCVSCRCGATKRSVPCGSERKAKPPDCSNLCARSTRCDHSKIQNHRCHYGDCPKCRIPCGKTLSPCRHQCPAVCHTTKGPNKGGDSSGGSKPCPKCVLLVPSKCPLHRGRGVQVLCHLSDSRCSQICQKTLACGEHTCPKPCHEGEGLLQECGDCLEPCGKQRPPGCGHGCELGCHTGDCQRCTLVSKVTCHCGGEDILVQCYKQGRLSEAETSCKNQCPKKLACGHRCLTLCHSGPCPELEKCRRKVKLTCKCKHVKKEVECFLVEESCGGNKDASTTTGKVLECQVGICQIAKKEKDTPTGGSGKKRTRKKKVSEGDHNGQGGGEGDNNLGGPANEVVTEGKDGKDGSIFSTNLKAIGIIALSAFFFATILKFYGSSIIPDEYRHSYNN